MNKLLTLALLFLAIPAMGQRVIDKKFIAVNGGYLVAGLLDTEMTQDCIRAGTCVEGNPLAPKSQMGQIGLVLGLTTLNTSLSYYLKAHGSRWWWVLPTVGIGVHAQGVYSGARYAEWRFAIP